MSLSRRRLIASAAAASVAGCGSSAGRPGRPGKSSSPTVFTTPTPTTLPNGKRPNIVYIFTDQLRHSVIGAAGDPVAVTPNLDALASSSVRFSRCYTNGPVCRPARGVMMSGRYPFQTGVIHNTTLPKPELPTHVRRMRDEAGYFTMLVGKFHLYEGDHHTDFYKDLLVQFGFSDSIELLGPTESSERQSAYSDWLSATTPTGEADKWDRYRAYIETYDWFTPPPDADPWDLTTEDNLDQFCARKASDWIRARTDDQPFYLQVNFPGPHAPFNGTTEFRALYDLETTPFPPAILVRPTEPSPLTEQYLAIKYEPWTDATWRALALSYYATVSLVDDAIGQVIAALTETGRLEDTWIVYGGDHGEMLGDHFLTGKVVFYEGATRQPLFVRPPGGLLPWASEALVDQTDVTSTILELGGLGNESGQPGASLLGKVLAGSSEPDAQVHRSEVFGGNIGYYYIRDSRFKAGYDPSERRLTELYDLGVDPQELTNLLEDPATEADRADLLARFESYWETWPILPDMLVGDVTDTG